MLGFDHDLRRQGFAGNSCQIILELSEAVNAAKLKERVAELVRENSILSARPVRGWTPRWTPTTFQPQVRVHSTAENLEEKLFNEPLDLKRGELLRFDVCGKKLIFTWTHALMDAKSAEYFLAVVGDEHLSVPPTGGDWYLNHACIKSRLRERFTRARQALKRLDGFSKALPISLATWRKRTITRTKFRLTTFSVEESARIHANAARLCGFLGDTNFHLAVTLVELHQLHQRVGCASASYVVPVPIGLRPKGVRAPLFSNQVTMALHQFFPDELISLPQTIAAFKSRHTEYLRAGQLDSGIILGQLFRKLPLGLYMRLIKQALRGEICSLFFGDTGTADSALENFLSARIESLVHVPAITVPPGLGVVFGVFRGQLRLTLVYAEGALVETEATKFESHLRERLLNP